MFLSDHFSYKEMTTSPYAVRMLLGNTPNEEQTNNLIALCRDVLEPIRTAYGKPIIVTSGFRSKTVNTRVGGSKNSDHCLGCAVDFRSVSDTVDDNKALFDCAQQLIANGTIKVRQLIDEYRYNWIHVSINRGRDNKCNEILHLQ